MFQSSAKFVYNRRSIEKVVEESKLEVEIENFNLLLGDLESPKVKLFSIDAVWWATVRKYITNGYNHCSFGINIEGKPGCPFKSISLNAKGEIDGDMCLDVEGVSIDTDCKGKAEESHYISKSTQYGGIPVTLANLKASGGSLVVNFSLSIVVKNGDEAQSFKFAEPVFMKKRILDNVDQMLTDSRFSDFTFIVKESEFNVHKAVLALTSDVFANLFTNDMKESRSNKCTINQFDPVAFGQMLKFIYSGKLPEDFNADIAHDLFEVAHYYDIKTLKDICEQEVLYGLNIDNALDLFKLSVVYDLEELKQKSWAIVKRDILHIYRPLKNEPLTPEQINKVLEHQQKTDEFWKEFVPNDDSNSSADLKKC